MPSVILNMLINVGWHLVDTQSRLPEVVDYFLRQQTQHELHLITEQLKITSRLVAPQLLVVDVGRLGSALCLQLLGKGGRNLRLICLSHGHELFAVGLERCINTLLLL